MSDEVPFWERANISAKELAWLRRRQREMSLALAQIQVLAAEEMGRGVVDEQDPMPKIEEIARAAIGE